MNKRVNILSILLYLTFALAALAIILVQTNMAAPLTLIACIPAFLMALLIFLKQKNPIMYFSILLIFAPHQALYYMYRADAYASRKRLERAQRDFERAIELEPQRAEIYLFRGRSFMNRQEYKQAIQDFDHALELTPDSFVGYNNRGWTYFYVKEYEQALQDFNQSINLRNNYYLTRQGRGCTLCRLGKWEEGIADLEYALQLSPNLSVQGEIYNVLGRAYHEIGEYKRAIEALHYALAAAPKETSSIYGNLGFSYVFLKEYQLALQACNQAIKLRPTSDPAYNNRGKAYLGLGNLQQAQADFARAVEIDPPFVTHTWYFLWTRLCQSSPDEEIAVRLEAIAAVNDGHPQAYNCLGVAAWIRGANENALQEFARSSEKKPIQWDAYFWTGLVYASLCRTQEAREAIQAALKHSLPLLLLLPLRQIDPALYHECLA